MRDLLQWSVLLWALLTILLHLVLLLYATSCRASNWWERRWAQRAERLRWILAWLISVLFLVALLTSCACKPSADPARLERRIQIPTPGSVLDSGIAINCTWRY